MDNSNVLQAILDKVTQIGEELSGFKKEVYARFDKVDGRIDKLGMQIANLEDDAPTREEFENLEDKVEKIQKHIAAV